jgi:hypothetical protein
MNLGRAYETKHMWVRALGEYRRAVSERPDYAPARRGISRILGLLN